MPSVSNGPGSGSVSGGSGYDSDSSYVIRKRTIKSGKLHFNDAILYYNHYHRPIIIIFFYLVPKPASPSVYRAVQRGEDIPFEGLQMPAPNRQTTHSNQRANKCKSFYIQIPIEIRIQNVFRCDATNKTKCSMLRNASMPKSIDDYDYLIKFIFLIFIFIFFIFLIKSHKHTHTQI